MQKQQLISTAKLRQRVGQELQVLVEQKTAEGYAGRSYADAPEIDGLVYIITKAELKIGEFCPVKITDSDEYDCYGHLPG